MPEDEELEYVRVPKFKRIPMAEARDGDICNHPSDEFAYRLVKEEFVGLYDVKPVNVYLEDGTLVGAISRHEVFFTETKLFLEPAEAPAISPDEPLEIRMPVYTGDGFLVGYASRFVTTSDGLEAVMDKKDETHG